MSPVARTLQRIREIGGVAGVVERRLPRGFTTVDLFGCIDVVAVMAGQTYGVQATTGDHAAHRIKKARDNKELRAWLMAGNHFEVWSWSQRVAYNKDGSKAKVKRWSLRRDMFARHGTADQPNTVWVTRKEHE